MASHRILTSPAYSHISQSVCPPSAAAPARHEEQVLASGAGVALAQPPVSSPAEGAADPADPWAPLLEAGLGWLSTLAPAAGASGAALPGAGPRVTVDPATGEQRLSLPMPSSATVRRLSSGLAVLLARLQASAG